MNKVSGKNNIDLALTIVSVVVVLGLAIVLNMFPEESTSIADKIFWGMLEHLGSVYLWFGIFSVIFCFFIAFSKYGRIRLGASTPQFSRMRFFAMMVGAGLGAATLYWGFVEVIYYYTDPPLGLESQSVAAAEVALSYNMHHYGLIPWSFYTIGALPMCYCFYQKKNRQLRLSAVCEEAYGSRIVNSYVRKIIDFLTLFIAIGALTITSGLSIPVISNALVDLFGLQPGILLNIGIMLFIALIFTLSSAIGVEKGMKNISTLNIYLCLAFLVYVFIIGPKIFTLENTTSSVGQYLQNIISMSTWMDPIQGGSFPKAWTIFYWAYWFMYTPPMVVFITKISKGQRLKDVVFLTMFGGTIGSIVLLGILGNYSLSQQLTGSIDCADLLTSGQAPQLVLELLRSMPASSLCVLVYILSCSLFMATTVDGFSFSIASVTTRKLGPNDEPSTSFRLFWCIILTILPLTMIYIGAPLNTLKTVALLVGTPFLLIFSAMALGLIRWLKQDYDQNLSEKKNSIIQ